MPKLEQYKVLQPYSLEELTDAANSLLRAKPQMQVNPRAIRYYISLGILPPPKGAPKVARYSYEHLTRLLAAKAFQDQGYRLERIKEELDTLYQRNREALESFAQRWLDDEEGPTPTVTTLVGQVSDHINRLLVKSPLQGKSHNFTDVVPDKKTQDKCEQIAESLSEFDDFTHVIKIALTPHSVLEVSAIVDLEEELQNALNALQRRLL